jgi:signal transduction histidine kinase
VSARAAIEWRARAEALEREMCRREQWANLGRLAAEAGAEIKGLLSGIAARCELVRVAAQQGEADKIAANCVAIATEIERAQGAVVELIDVSGEQGARTALDLNALVRGAIEFTASLNRYENIRFVPRLEEGLPRLRAERRQIQQVLITLFANAADAMGRRKGEGGCIWVSTALHADERCVEIAVRDEGPGVPAAARDRIFEPGFSLREGRRGMGLAVARELARAHGGSLVLAPASDQAGAEFRLRLPL